MTATYALGTAGDKPVTGDVNGDGSLDIGVYRNGTWYVSTDKVNVNIAFGFGGVPGDLPLFLDWNNDGKADACIYRNGTWYINLNKGGATPFDGHADITFVYGAAGDVPLIGKSRYFGYYAASPTPATEYGAHSNLTWEPWWSFATRGVAAKSATIYSAVVDITDLVYCRSNDGANCNGVFPNKWIYRGSAAAQTSLKTQFDGWKQAGVLNMIVALYPLDEPDGWIYPGHNADIVSVNNDIRTMMAKYTELHATKVGVIYSNYAAGWNGWHMEVFDWVGFDEYGSGDFIFNNGHFDQLKAHLMAGQRALIAPGGAAPWYHDPSYFGTIFAYDQKVVGLIPFIWEDYQGAGSGIRDNGMAHDYCMVGGPIKGAWNGVCP